MAAGLGSVVSGLVTSIFHGKFYNFIPGVYMGWGLGANDSANVFGTAVATRVVTYKRAITLTAIFVVLGAYLQGARMMPLFKKLSTLDPTAAIFAALGAAISMHAMTYWAIPTSSSQAIIGAVIGIGILDGTAQFAPLKKVVLCWVLTPIGAGFLAFALYSIFGRIFSHYVRSIRLFDSIVTWAILVSGCYGAYSLGANNVGNVCGVYYGSGMLDAQQAALLGGLGIALGAVTYSKKVMRTVGQKITTLDPFSAAITIFSAALTVHVFVYIGVPVSTSQAAVGAVAGIGFVKDARAVSRKTLLNCVLGWGATPIIAAIFGAGFVWLTRTFG